MYEWVWVCLSDSKHACIRKWHRGRKNVYVRVKVCLFVCEREEIRPLVLIPAAATSPNAGVSSADQSGDCMEEGNLGVVCSPPSPSYSPST